jgi:hypothetical protein
LIPPPETRDRRQFLHDAARALAATGSVALFGSLSACSGPGTGSAGPRSTTTTAPPPTTEPLDPAAWASLSGSLDGTLVLPASPSYAEAKLVYNLRFADLDPAAVAYCASAVDVQRCLSFARTHGIAPTPRSGGHSYGGYSSGSGLVIDVSRLNTVTTDPSTMAAVIGTGTQLVDVYAQLSDAGMLLPAGSCPTVGIAGLTLGGGVGVVSRKYGLTCDNLTSVDIVTADGRILTASRDENEDLFWASQGGGGGNFGIATSFTFALHPLPSLALFTINWPGEAGADVLGQWQQWIATAPDELWSNCQLQSAGPDGLNVRANGVFVGNPQTLTAALAPLLKAATPTDTFIGPEVYLHAMLVEAGCGDLTLGQCHLSGASATGTLPRSSFAATSAYLTSALSNAGIAAAVQAIEQLHDTLPEFGGGLVFDAYGGLINTVAPDATAFVHRSALAALQTSVSWGPGDAPSSVDRAQAWLAQTATSMAPNVSKTAYQNYIDPTLENWADAYYGANLPRLVQIKRRYDPDDVFHFAQSIPTVLPTD